MLSVLAALYAVSAAQQPLSLAPAEQAQLETNLALGERLYEYDQSAWHVTDAAMAALSDEAKSHLRGYVTTPDKNGLRTTFYGTSDGGHYSVYSAVWSGAAIVDARIHPLDRKVPVTAEEERMITARSIALEAAGPLITCSNAQPNVIVIPSTSGETVHVYVLTPQTSARAYPLGGHHRIDVKKGKVVASRSFSKSCITLEPGNAVGMVITHLLDPVPTEIHVFSVFATGLPLFVTVPDGRIYVVEVSEGVPRARTVGKVQ